MAKLLTLRWQREVAGLEVYSMRGVVVENEIEVLPIDFFHLSLLLLLAVVVVVVAAADSYFHHVHHVHPWDLLR